jgi:N-acetylmuramic acid 6-phosphate etherase
MNKSTETSSNYNDIEKMDTLSVLENINKEDKLVALAVQKEIPKIESLVDAIYTRMKDGGRLFYMGAGTSGRLGVVDASECPPTFGVDHGLVVGLIAGGDRAIRKAVENAEDDTNQGWKDLQEYNINDKDSVIGIAASGSTPYVIGAIKECNKHQILSASISCNSESPLSQVSKHPIEVVVGPEFITGSTRMKAGTAQKLVLNMISTSLMIKLGKVVGNKMVDMQLSNNKLVDRGTKMVMEQTNLDYQQANTLLMKYGSVRNAINNHKNG